MMMNALLLLISLALIAAAGIKGLAVILAMTLVSYLSALAAERRPKAAWAGIALSLIPLLTVRLVSFGSGIFGALGLSYFTLQTVSYLADVMNGRYPPEKNIVRYALFVCYYPHLQVGPIYRFGEFSKELENRSLSWDRAMNGMLRVSWGLFKMFVIASRADLAVSAVTSDTASFRGLFVLFAVFLYSLELYADFSGGVDIVIGVTRILGFSLPENFDRPFLSETVAEFWRRWHITLGTFLREYVYIPLGGNRKGTFRKYLNTMAVFLVSGFWHGSGYMLWGAVNGILVCTGDLFKTKSRTLNRIITFILISLLWIFFIYGGTKEAVVMFVSIFRDFDATAFISGFDSLGVAPPQYAVLAVSALILAVFDLKRGRIKEGLEKKDVPAKLAVSLALVLTVLLFGVYGIGFDANAFIYNRF